MILKEKNKVGELALLDLEVEGNLVISDQEPVSNNDLIQFMRKPHMC